jgi:hypothetical protein
MKFRGGRIKSVNYPPNDNQWVNYSEYTIEIEFNEAEFFGCDTSHEKSCSNVLFNASSHPNGINTVQEHLVDTKKFKIKAFNDTWNINLGDEIYDWGKVNGSLEINNKRYTIQYSISATGQHYWDDAGNLFPAWKQAKAFCQDRLVKQINALYNNMAMHYDGPELEPCGSAEDLTKIHKRTQPSIHTTIGPMFIFNETITFDVGEAEGTFTANYSSVVKKAKETCVTSADTIHNLSITYGGSNTCGKTKMDKVASLSGTIEGLVRDTTNGSIIWPNSEGFRIPDTPGQIVFLPPQADKTFKWKNAKILLDRFLDECDGRIICAELCSAVTKCLSDPDQEQCKDICAPSCPRPSNFSVTHNYAAGTIDYSVDLNYDNDDIGGNRCNVVITTEEPVPLKAEFTIPGRGIYYQPLGGCTPKKWSIAVDGRLTGYTDNQFDCDPTTGDLINVCGCLPKGCTKYIPSGQGFLLESKQQTFNPIDGSFSYNATYICTICPPLVECGSCP